jgi:hypothetical protein
MAGKEPNGTIKDSPTCKFCFSSLVVVTNFNL